MDKLIEAAIAMLDTLEEMRCIPDDSHADNGCWFGEFSEWEEDRDQNMIIVEWPNLHIVAEQLRAALEEAKK